MNRIRLAGCALIAATISAASAAGSSSMLFEKHAIFFSTLMKQEVPIDPHVFVANTAAQAATGPQGIKHAAAFRPALIGSDPDTAPVSNADGKPLGFTLGAWLGATGTLTLTPRKEGGETVTMRFHGLRPQAEYSLFKNHFDRTPVTYTPLDGKGIANSFHTDAKGDARVIVVAPDVMNHDNAVLVVYHSDDRTHGESRGAIGINAHHQLIARPPVE